MYMDCRGETRVTINKDEKDKEYDDLNSDDKHRGSITAIRRKNLVPNDQVNIDSEQEGNYSPSPQ